MESLMNNINEFILQPLIWLMVVVAFLVFLWGIFQFIIHSDNDEKRKEGSKHMLWGIVGMVIMVSAYGIVAILKGTLGV